MDTLRAQCDELLGKDRNIPMGERKKTKVNYENPDVNNYKIKLIQKNYGNK